MQEQKKKAIQLVTEGASDEEIAQECDLPLPLVKEWRDATLASTDERGNIIQVSPQIIAKTLLENYYDADKDDEPTDQKVGKINKYILETSKRVAKVLASTDISDTNTMRAVNTAANTLKEIRAIVSSYSENDDEKFSTSELKKFSDLV